jgi:hypothetical protein
MMCCVFFAWFLIDNLYDVCCVFLYIDEIVGLYEILQPNIIGDIFTY